MADFYQIPTPTDIKKNSPEYLRWEKLNFIIRQIYDLIGNIDGRQGPVTFKNRIKMNGYQITNGPIMTSAQDTDYVTKSWFKTAEFGKMAADLVVATGKTPISTTISIGSGGSNGGGNGNGTDDHSALNNLSYSTAGHTGFTPSNRSISTTAPLAGGGDLSLNRTLSIPAANANNNGHLTATDWNTFNNKQNVLPAANATNNGYLSNVDWATFNNAVQPSRTISTTAPLAGGGDLSSNRTLSIPPADTSNNGYLSNNDWNIFNNKQNALTIGSLTELTSSVLTIGSGTGSVIGSGTTITVKRADANNSGYLSNADWIIFNGKQDTLPQADANNNGYLSNSDWSNFNNASGTFDHSALNNLDYANANHVGFVPDTIEIITTAPLTGGNNLAANVTIAIPVADANNNGYLSNSDWGLFNNKLNSYVYLTGVNASAPLQDTVIPDFNNNTFSIGLTIAQANATVSGYLSNADWSNFNNAAGGGLTEVAVTAPLTGNGVPLDPVTIPVADANNSGYLSNTDWSNFNNATGGGNGNVGPGNNNYLAMFTASDTVGDSIVYQNGTNIGIGTTAPDRQLTIFGPQALIRLNRFFPDPSSNASPSWAPAILMERTHGNVAAPAGITDGDWLGKLQFRGNNGVASLEFGAIAFISNNAADQTGRFAFVDKDLATERMVITNDGKVGIGNSAPLAPLAVNNLNNYANSTAAIAGGLNNSDFFRTGDVVRVVDSTAPVPSFNNSVVVTVYDTPGASGTWTKNNNTVAVSILLIGGGGGGGCGRHNQAINAARAGGGGGGGGACTKIGPFVMTGNNAAYAVGSGGNGSASTHGAAGTASTFGIYTAGGGGGGAGNLALASGGGGGGTAGNGGSATSATPADGGWPGDGGTVDAVGGTGGWGRNQSSISAEWGGGGGGGSSNSGNLSNAGSSVFGGGGGGGGGAISTANGRRPAGNGGGHGVYANGAGGAAGTTGDPAVAGSNGAAGIDGAAGEGGGGGGCSSNNSSGLGPGAKGGDGGYPGGGGGGGGAGCLDSAGGAGGNGAGGIIVITEYLA